MIDNYQFNNVVVVMASAITMTMVYKIINYKLKLIIINTNSINN